MALTGLVAVYLARACKSTERGGRGLTDTDFGAASAESPPFVASGEKARRHMPDSTRRILLIIAGVIVLAVSVAGFYLVSDVFDKRTPVLVAAVEIQKGETVSASYFTFSEAVMGPIPHIAYTPDAPYAFEGFVASQTIPAGTIVLGNMMIPPESQPFGNQLEVTVQFDTSLATTEVREGDDVLLVDPGAAPTGEDSGRPQQAIRSLTLRNYRDGAMTMYLDPEEWAEWRALPAALGATPRILPVPIGGDADEFAQRINAVWQAEWEEKTAAVAASITPAGPQPGPGELEVVISFDVSLVPSGVSEGDTVLMIDPGQPPSREDIGRPRKVLRTIQLVNFDGSAMRLFVPPEEWADWQSLPEDLGGAPMVLPVPDGTDIDDMARRLDAEWNAEWELAINELSAQGATG